MALEQGRGRDRAGSRDRAHAADGGALRRAPRRHRRGAPLAAGARASATTSGGGCARARRASASARARRSSPRSSDLGLVVVDEEHDSSYKHEGDPRYDARAVAAERARASRARCSCSAAPRRGRRAIARPRAVRLAHRVDRRPLPPVRVLDMRGRAAGLHPETVHALAGAAPRRRQGDRAAQPARLVELPLLPRVRARLGMPEVRRRARPAPRRRRALPATTAGIASPCPTRCECGSRSIARHGMGTERLASGAPRDRRRRGLPGLPPRRRPRPAARARGGEAAGPPAVLGRFERAPAGVLLGTQMVAKGHDFPDVTLGVVLDADSSLSFPDFRAEERTFALLAQLAGRVGRGADGHVLVQTLAPEARAIRHAALHDSAGFLDGRARAPAGARAIRPSRTSSRSSARRPRRQSGGGRRGDSASACGRNASATTAPSVLGPGALFRLRGRERRALLLKASDRESTVRAVDEAVARSRRRASTRASASASTSNRSEPRKAQSLKLSHDAQRADAHSGGAGAPTTRSRCEERRPEELDPETRARRDAALRHVRKLGDPVLRAARASRRALRRRAQARGRAHGGAHARRARYRARRQPGRRAPPRLRLPRERRGSADGRRQPGDRARERRARGRRRGLPEPSRGARRGRAPGGGASCAPRTPRARSW